MSSQFFFVYTQLNAKTVLLQAIQLNISTPFSFIWPIDRALSGATTPGQGRFGNNGSKRVFHIPQSSNFTGASPPTCLV